MMAYILPIAHPSGVNSMIEQSDKTTVEDAKLDPSASTSRGVGISITTWIMVLVFLAIVAFGALMIGGFLGPGLRNQSPISNDNSVARP
jgi:hypothetical protein